MRNRVSRKRTGKRVMALFLMMAMVFSLFSAMATGVSTVPAHASTLSNLSIEPLGDQSARIIVASASGGVNWGSEPLVLTIRVLYQERFLFDYTGVEFSVDIANENLLAHGFSGLNGNVLTLVPLDVVGHTDVTVTATRNGETAETTFRVVVSRYEDTGEYLWGNLSIPGGGAVCGYIFHPRVPGILYAQTDVGGAHRFNFETRMWEDITQWVTPDIQLVGQSRGVAVDPTPGREDWVYLINNVGGPGTVFRSEDRGDTWVRLGQTGTNAGGNSGNTRGIGGNFVIRANPLPGRDPNSDDPADFGEPTMFFATAQHAPVQGGFSISHDNGLTWENLRDGENSPFNNGYLDQTQFFFVNFDPYNTDFLVVGTVGATSTDNNNMAGPRTNSVFYSNDDGATWQVLPNQPLPRAGGAGDGYHGIRAAFTAPHNDAGDRFLFVTYTDSGNAGNPGVNDGAGQDGAVFRWTISADGEILETRNITPVIITGTAVKSVAGEGEQFRMSGVGFAGLSVDPNNPGTLIVGTHNTDPYNVDTTRTHRGMETIFRSLDYGETWFPVIAGYNMFGNLQWGLLAPYSSPAVNGQFHTNMWEHDPYGQTASEFWWEPWTFLHWNFGPQINPHDPDNLFINSGLGTYVTFNLTALDHLAEHAVPHATAPATPAYAPAAGEIEGQRGIFRTVDGRLADRVTNDYSAFRIGNSINNLTAEESVKWETAPGLYMTVQKHSAVWSPPSGRNIVLTNTWDYPGWAFQSVDHLPWNGWGYARWIPEEWEYLFEDWREVTERTCPSLLPPRPNTGRTYNIYAPTNRGISGDNTDFPDANPDIIVSTARSDWHFMFKGGAIISFDGGLIWHNLPDGYELVAADHPNWEQDPPGFALLGTETDMPDTARAAARNLKWSVANPGGIAAGLVAISADATTVVWSVGNAPNIVNTVFTRADNPLDLGQLWEESRFYESQFGDQRFFIPPANTAATGTPADIGSGSVTGVRIVSDRVDPDVFYAFTNRTIVVGHGYNAEGEAVAFTNVRNYAFVSRDGAETFRPVTITSTDGYEFPMGNVWQGVNGNRAIRGEIGNPYVLWVDGNGLYRLVYNRDTHTMTSTRVLGNDTSTPALGLPNSTNGRAGLGLGIDGVANGALYAFGRTEAVPGDGGTGWGVYRSLDGGETWLKINVFTDNPEPEGTPDDPFLNANHNFADVRGVTGDPRVFGRVFLTQGNVAGGIRVGEIIVNLLEYGGDAN